jgi:hypothetical protein
MRPKDGRRRRLGRPLELEVGLADRGILISETYLNYTTASDVSNIEVFYQAASLKL